MPGLPAIRQAGLGQGHAAKKDIPMLFSAVSFLGGCQVQACPPRFIGEL